MNSHCKFYSFLKAAHGNWHNAIFLFCTHRNCPYGHPHLCEGYLMVADAEGIPILMPVEHVRRLTGESISREECRSALGMPAFEAAYSLYIEWHTISSRDCPLRQLCQFTEIVSTDEITAKDVIPP